MKSKLRGKPDPIERQVELALHPGAFIRDSECFSFVSGLEEVAAAIDKLIATDPDTYLPRSTSPSWRDVMGRPMNSMTPAAASGNLPGP
jgi:hypothetical protein